MPISVNMLRLRLTIDSQPRTSSGHPAHSTTGVARASSIHVRAACGYHAPPRHHARHFDQHQRNRQRDAYPEAPRHVRQLGRGLVAGAHDARLQRHPADWTIARLRTDDLRMHRADVFGFRNRLDWRDRFERHAALRTRPRMVLPNLGMHRAGVRSASAAGALALGFAGAASTFFFAKKLSGSLVNLSRQRGPQK